MKINLLAVSMVMLLGGCASDDAAVTTGVVTAPTQADVVTPRPSPTKSFFIGAKPTPFPTLAPTPKPTPAPFKPKPAKGFSEAERRKIFYDLVNAEDRAREDADKVFSPIDDSTNNLAENERLTKKYKAEVIRDYRLSKSQVSAIQNEGLDNQWPPLTPLQSPY